MCKADLPLLPLAGLFVQEILSTQLSSHCGTATLPLTQKYTHLTIFIQCLSQAPRKRLPLGQLFASHLVPVCELTTLGTRGSLGSHLKLQVLAQETCSAAGRSTLPCSPSDSMVEDKWRRHVTLLQSQEDTFKNCSSSACPRPSESEPLELGPRIRAQKMFPDIHISTKSQSGKNHRWFLRYKMSKNQTWGIQFLGEPSNRRKETKTTNI